MRNSTLRRWTAAGVLVCIAASAHAFIPPSYRIAIIAEDRTQQALAHALVEYMAAEQAFFRVADDDFRYAARDCLKAESPVTCVRAGIAKAATAEPRAGTLAIVVSAEGDGRQRWRCLGSGARPAPAEVVDTTIDLKAALFGEGEERNANLGKALRCIQEAANEASPG